MPVPKQVTLADGSTRWRVRFANGSKSRTFFDERGAQNFADNISYGGPAYALRALANAKTEVLGEVSSAPTYDKAFKEFVEWKRPQMRNPRSITSYETHHKNVISPRIGSTPVDLITAQEVAALFDDLASGKVKSKRKGKAYSTASIGVLHSELHHVLDFCLDPSRRWIDSNPSTGVKLPKPVKRRPKGLTPGQFRLLREKVAERWNADTLDLTDFLIGTGWRFSESIALSPEGIEDYGMRMFINMSQVSRVVGTTEGSRVIVKDGKAQASLRRVEVDETTAGIIRRRMKDVEPGEAVFTVDGKLWTSSKYAHRLQVAGVAAGVPDVSPHWLRHTHVQWLSIAGATPADIQRRVGHASITTTFDVYGSMLGDVGEQALLGFAKMRDGTPDTLEQAPAHGQVLTGETVAPREALPR